jgi:hypothetical protein
MSRRQVMLVLGALAVVPLLFAAYVMISYQLALKSGRLPITNEPEWIWWSVLVGLLILGVYLVWLGVTRLKLLLVAVYAIAMTAILLGIHYWVACMSGDCL